MSDDVQTLTLVRINEDGSYDFDARAVLEPDNVYGKEGVTVAAQEYPDAENPDGSTTPSDWVGDEDIYDRPRVPRTSKRSLIRDKIFTYGMLELGVRVFRHPGTRERLLRLELWKRDVNRGELRFLGDCAPITHLTRRDDVTT